MGPSPVFNMFVRILVLSASLSLASCVNAPGETAPNESPWRTINLAATPHQLHEDKAAHEPITVGDLIYRGGLHLKSKDKDFGGYSGLIISPDGAELLALSDRSHWMRATLGYDANGRLQSASNARIARVTDADKQPLMGDGADAEAIVKRGAELFVSFERVNRIDVYREDADGDIVFSRKFTAFDNDVIPFNKGVEAMATLSDNRLIALTEAAPSDAGGIVGWIVSPDGGLAELSYQPAITFSPTDAVTTPDGDLLVVERAFDPVLGPRARLVRINSADIAPGAKLKGKERARFHAPYLIDNMEGLAIRETDDGQLMVYLMSDDNQNRRQQKTLLFMFELMVETN